ncbi:MAG: hypothetical protein AMXMBFR84_15380 [Candidatus Hydrogenedentota bacterium]
MTRCISVFSAITLSAHAFALDITGTIYNEDEIPVQGAMVKVYTAKPRVGQGVLCPSCYLDCAKRDTTKADGTFTLPDVDPSLLFKLLIVEENYTPQFIENTDPELGPVLAKLVARDPERLKTGHVLRGRVLNPQGKPVAGAVIEPFAIHFENSTRFGGLDGIDALAATNAEGVFMITSEKPGVKLSVSVEATGLAKKNFPELAAGDKTHDLSLQFGSTVTGKVLNNGKPVAGVSMGITQTSHASDTFLGEMEVATGSDGTFVFANVPSQFEYTVYSQLSTPIEDGVVREKILRIDKENDILDVGVLETQRGHTVTGRIVLSDGAQVPEGTKVMFSRERAWDWAMAEVDPQGNFTIKNLPREEYSVTCNVPDYHLSEKNYSLDPLNQNGLMGVIESDIENLTLLFEPGKWEWKQSSPESTKQYLQLKTEPIRGADES